MDQSRPPSAANVAASTHQDTEPEGLQAVQSQLVDRGLCLCTLLGFPALVSAIVRAVDHGWHWVVPLYAGLYAALAGVCVFRRRISHVWRSIVLLGVLLISGVASHLVFGIASGGGCC